MTSKRLYRSRKDRIIWGVAGGLAEYANVDPTLVRVVFILLAFAGGSAVLAYIILALVVPTEPYQPDPTIRTDGGDVKPPPDPVVIDSARQREEEVRWEEEHSRRRNILGFGLVILGGIILLVNLGRWWNWGILGPVIVILAGALILLAGFRRR